LVINPTSLSEAWDGVPFICAREPDFWTVTDVELAKTYNVCIRLTLVSTQLLIYLYGKEASDTVVR
jgi:hypothetical protein